MVRMQIALRADEADALLQLATAELRDPRDQAHLLIRNELVRRGLLPSDEKAEPVESSQAARQ